MFVKKVLKKIPVSDQEAIWWQHFPNEVLPIFLCLEYYLEFLEKKSPDPGVPL